MRKLPRKDYRDKGREWTNKGEMSALWNGNGIASDEQTPYSNGRVRPTGTNYYAVTKEII